MKTYVCQTIDTATNQCTQWIEQANFIPELSQLSYSDTNQLLSLTAALFACAWVWSLLSRKAEQGA